ncbi:MAG: hypothetical protein KY466_07785 [Gemmatimonadetes bacterium]|nr:hypothetical protein [Gemmatimonadota bacterium]
MFAFRIRPQLAAALAVLTAAACSGEVNVPSPGEPQPAPPGQASVTVPTSTAAPGSSITVRAAGFTPGSTLEIGLGQPRSEYSVVAEVDADAQGRVETTVEVPAWTSRGEAYVIVVTEPDHDPRVTSESFVVGEAGDPIRVHGKVTEEGVECPAIRGPFGTLYTLAVSEFDQAPGTELMVEGRIAGVSTCMQGTTIDVQSVSAH